MKKESQSEISNKKMKFESVGNYQQVSAENFNREMTLVYLMLKGEYSQQKIADDIDNFAIIKTILSPSCKISPIVVQANDDLTKVPICDIENCKDVDNKDSLLTPVEKIKVIIPTASKSSLKIKNIAAFQIIDERVAGFITIQSADIQVKLKEAECKKVSIPTVSNGGRTISRLSSIIAHKVPKFIITKSTDVQVELNDVECNRVLVPSIRNIKKENSRLTSVIVHKVSGVITAKSANIQVELKDVEYGHVSVPSVLDLGRIINKLDPVTVSKVAGVISAKSSDIQVKLKDVEYTKVLVPSISELCNIDEVVFSAVEKDIISINVFPINPHDVISDRIHINGVKVKIQSVPNIMSLWEIMGGPAALIKDYR
jgi:hypothetical protein